ncbi:hypothetical protein SEA_CREWMATE_45 [Arthrobacter phage Crewmate]|uniref:Uncharacterized protein n=1 Tax=Arthrobacter phage Crewmate TaxID=2832317 RepID=A0AA48Y4F6_9CAUD|nr:hypothetical protein PQE17_gp45 [Arthrobacter phage Crewmate]UIW13297.1 hypothetical protein SEA_CREWMATE_45 [Arthrobacter phage Crewmate]WGH21221.1 hypothetical protein SEA_OBITOO_45 [Arthrobacter phage ObiToo]
MGHRQKGKGAKRKRSWHRRGSGPDRAFAYAMRRLARAGMN